MKGHKYLNRIFIGIFVISFMFINCINVQAIEEDKNYCMLKKVLFDKRIIRKSEKFTINIEVDGYGSELSENAYIGLVSNNGDRLLEKGIVFQLDDGKYTKEIDTKDFEDGLWKISFIILENKAKYTEIIYNSNVHSYLNESSAFKEDFSSMDFYIVNGEIEGLYSVKIENLNDTNYFKVGDLQKIKLKAVNCSHEPQKVTMIIALFDENNDLINYIVNKQINIAVGGTEELSSTIKLNSAGKVKIFFWDCIDSMNILSNAIEFNISE